MGAGRGLEIGARTAREKLRALWVEPTRNRNRTSTMQNSTLRIAGAAAAVVLFASNVIAQTVAPEAGLIGRRYAGADFTYDHFSGSSFDKAMGAAAVVNLPLNHKFDLNMGYSYADTSGDNVGAIDKSLNASLVVHNRTEYGTAYFASTLGHLWNRVSGPGVGRTENGAYWGFRAGYEVGVGARSAVNFSLGYADGFDRDNARAHVLRFAAEANHWFSRDVAGVAGISYRQLKESADPIGYSLGLRWAF
jgi:hypothetical protein